MKLTAEAINLIKSHEGLRLKAYLDPVGVVTIGYGTTAKAGIGVVPRMGMVITEAQAEEYLVAALDKFAATIVKGFKVDPTPNQYGALMSLAYNIGPTQFLKSTALRRFNAGDLEGAAEAITWFNKAGGKVLRGLVRRRQEEATLFLKDQESVSTEILPKPDALRSNPLQSTTNIASGVQAVAGGSAVVTAIGALSGPAQIAAIVVGGIVVLLAGYVIYERSKKWNSGDR